MKDYTDSDFQKQTFIIRYDIDKETKEIIIRYADGEIRTMEYSLHNEIMILEKMKNQVYYYADFKDRIKIDRLFWLIKKYMCLSGAGFGSIVLGALLVACMQMGIVAVAMLPSVIINILMIMVMKKYFDLSDDQVQEINRRIKDYDKSVFYLHNEQVLSNERLLRRDVINKIPTRVRFILSKGKIEDEVPLVSINSIDDLSMKDLKKSYEASLQSHGPELTIKKANK